MSESYTTTKILSRSQYIPVFIPISSSIRVFKKIYGDSWYELDRVDLMEGSSPDTYSYDDQLFALLFNPILIGNVLQIQYSHDGIPNPGVVDLLPTVLAEQAHYTYNCVVSGLYGVDSYMQGNIPCGSKASYVLDSGVIRINGILYSVGNTYWDLNKFGAQSGDNIVTSMMYYIAESKLSDTQLNTRFIRSPSIFRSKQYALNDGMGISSSMTELNDTLQNFFTYNDRSGFIEIMRLTVISKKAPDMPDIYSHYEPRYRILPSI